MRRIGFPIPVALLVMLILGAALLGTAEAAKPSHAGTPGGPNAPVPELTATVVTILGEDFAVLSGTGYHRNTSVNIYSTGNLPWLALADGDGNWTRTIPLKSFPWTAVTWQYFHGGWNKMASVLIT